MGVLVCPCTLCTSIHTHTYAHTRTHTHTHVHTHMSQSDSVIGGDLSAFLAMHGAEPSSPAAHSSSSATTPQTLTSAADSAPTLTPAPMRSSPPVSVSVSVSASASASACSSSSSQSSCARAALRDNRMSVSAAEVRTHRGAMHRAHEEVRSPSRLHDPGAGSNTPALPELSEVLRDCRDRGVLFEDADFPPTDASLFAEPIDSMRSSCQQSLSLWRKSEESRGRTENCVRSDAVFFSRCLSLLTDWPDPVTDTLTSICTRTYAHSYSLTCSMTD
jgi:hypothetical protein